MDKFLRNNNVLRILALILACILWLAVHAPDKTASSSSPTQAGITSHSPFPIHVEVGDDMVVSSMSQSTATVNVTTSISRMTTLAADMLKVQLVVNAQGLGSGTQTLPIAAVNMPNDIRGYTIKPSTVTVVLEKKAHVQKPIDVQVKGSPARGYTIGKLQLNTQSVEVSGAPKLVHSVTRVVGTVDVGGMKNSATKIVNLTPVDSQGNTVQNIDLTTTSISVNVPIEAASQKVKLQPEVTGMPAPGYAVSKVTLDNTVVSETGLAKSALPPNGLNVPVDVTGLSKDATIDVTVPLLQGMTKVTPDTVTATVTIEPSVTMTLQQIPVSVQNEPKNTKVTLSGSPKVDVTLSGPQSVLSGISAKDVQAYVNAANLQPGNTAAQVTVRVPKWVEVASISQRTVPVQVTAAAKG